MRIHLIAGLVLLVAGTALGQDAAKQKRAPGRMSLPSAPMFRGGFARIGPTATVNTPRTARGPSAPTGAGRDTAAALPQQPDEHEHHHDESGGCTGQCDDDHDAASPRKAAQGPDAAKGEHGEHGESHTPSTEPRTNTGQPTSKTSPRGSYCASCHPRGIPKAKSAERGTRPLTPDTRIAAIKDLRLRERDRVSKVVDPRMVATTGVVAPFAQVPSAPPEAPAARPAVDQPALALVDDLSAQLGEHPDDFRLMRELAVAQLAAKRPREAADTIAKAYKADPLLSKEPLDAKALGLSKPALSSLANAAATHARTSKKPQAWLLAAVMFQAQEARPQALAAVDSARGAGLDADLCDWMVTSLKAKPKQLADAK